MKKILLTLCLIFAWSLSVSAADIPVWRVLWTILPEVDATRADGVRFVASMSNADISAVMEMARRAEHFIESAAMGAVDFEIKVMLSGTPVTTLSTFSDDNTYVWQNDLPYDVRQEISEARTKGDPYQLVISTVRLGDANDALLGNYWCFGRDRYSSVRLLKGTDLSYLTPTSDNPYPEEPWIYPLCSCLSSFYVSLGYAVPGAHEAEDYGYKRMGDLNFNGYYKFYQDIFSAQVRDPKTGERIGITPEMWRHMPEQRRHTEGNDSTSGGGCDLGLGALGLLAIVAVVLRRK